MPDNLAPWPRTAAIGMLGPRGEVMPTPTFSRWLFDRLRQEFIDRSEDAEAALFSPVSVPAAPQFSAVSVVWDEPVCGPVSVPSDVEVHPIADPIDMQEFNPV